MENITESLTKEQWLLIRNMIDSHMQRNIYTFNNEQLDAGWEFIATIDCFLGNT